MYPQLDSYLARSVKASFYPLVNLTPIQRMMYSEPRRFIFVSSGRRSRKTLILKRKMLRYALRHPGESLFQGAPTLQQAKAIFWEDLKRQTKYIRRAISESELWVELINGTRIHVAGLDKPQRIEGRPWNGFHITEAPDLKPKAWEENLLPLISDTDGFAWMDGVPNGRDATYYPMCLDASGGVIPPIDDVIRGGIGTNPDRQDMVYYLWHSSTVLTPEQLAVFMSIMDARTFRQEFEGSFESAGGLAYWAFGKHNLDPSLVRDPKKQVTVGMDFNVNPMTASLFHIDERARTAQQFGEIINPHSNTYEMVVDLKRELKLKPYGDQDPGSVVIIPDFTGHSNRSSSIESDIGILRSAGFAVYSVLNPDQRDRLTAHNSMMRAVDGRVGYTLNPQTCKQTVNDYGLVTTHDNGRIDKSKEKDGIGHVSDSVGYVLNYHFSIRRRLAGTI